MSNDLTPKRYHPIHVVLHWLVALIAITQLLSGVFVLSPTPNDQELPLLGGHKMMGILLGVFMIARLITRFVFKRPAAADAGHPALNIIGKAVHFLLYAGVFAMMFTGDALDEAYGLETMLKGGGGSMPADFFVFPQRFMHGNIAYLMLGIIALHIGAALYHQFVRKDNLFGRMWFGK